MGSTRFTRFDAVTSLYVIVELRVWGQDSGGQRSSLNEWKASRPGRSYRTSQMPGSLSQIKVSTDSVLKFYRFYKSWQALCTAVGL